MPALVIGTNSWVTIAEADSYLAGKFGADDWAGLTDTIKQQCLISAYRWINRLHDYTIGAVTDPLKYAQIELAWWTYKNIDTWEKHEALLASGVKQFRISKFWESVTAIGLPQVVKDLLGDYLTNAGGYLPTMSRDVENNE